MSHALNASNASNANVNTSSIIQDEPLSAEITPHGTDLVRKREGSVISPGIDALLDAKYQQRVGRLGFAEACMSNKSANEDAENKMLPLQPSTQLK